MNSLILKGYPSQQNLFKLENLGVVLPRFLLIDDLKTVKVHQRPITEDRSLEAALEMNHQQERASGEPLFCVKPK